MELVPANLIPATPVVPPAPPEGWAELLSLDSPAVFIPVDLGSVNPAPAPIVFVANANEPVNPPVYNHEPVHIEFNYTPINPKYDSLVNPVPEPGGFIVLGTGVLGLAAHCKRRRNAIRSSSASNSKEAATFHLAD